MLYIRSNGFILDRSWPNNFCPYINVLFHQNLRENEVQTKKSKDDIYINSIFIEVVK